MKTEQAIPKHSINVLGYSIYVGDMHHLLQDEQKLINTINQYSYCISEQDLTFEKALKKSDILLPDGVGIVWAVRLFTGKRIKKIAGADLHEFLLEHLNTTNGKCFYLGASESTLQKISEKLSIEYPNIQLKTYSPPFKAQFDKSDNEKMVAEVNSFKPDVLFIGMTAPKQEKWALNHVDQLDAKNICSIGAVFDFYAGTVQRPSKFWISLGLEWFVRLLKEPKRMSKRYLFYGPAFIYMIIKQYFQHKFIKKAVLR